MLVTITVLFIAFKNYCHNSGRQRVTKDNLDEWRKCVDKIVAKKTGLRECFLDPTRVFNQDETGVQLGGQQRVLALKGTKVNYKYYH